MYIVVINLFVSILIIVFLIVILQAINTKNENYRGLTFPESEAHYYYNQENQWGIPRCKYKSYTPILIQENTNFDENKKK
jgi:hypothetical protein